MLYDAVVLARDRIMRAGMLHEREYNIKPMKQIQILRQDNRMNRIKIILSDLIL
jgi:hypothetical protein